jgi:hypothetical protein
MYNKKSLRMGKGRVVERKKIKRKSQGKGEWII